MNNMYKAVDYYFQQEMNPDNIPDILLEKNNEYLVKNIAVRYIKHPIYWTHMQKWNQDFKIYSVGAKELFKYCKYVITKFNLNPKADKFYIRRSNIKQPYNEKLFKEFSEYIDKKTLFRFSHKDKELMYTTLLTEEEKIAFTPSLAKKYSMVKGKKKIKDLIAEAEASVPAQDDSKFFEKEINDISKYKDIDIIIVYDDASIEHISKLRGKFGKFKQMVLNLDMFNKNPEVIKQIQPRLVIGYGKDTYSYLSDKLTKNSKKFFVWEQDNNIAVTVLPTEHKNFDDYIENIIEFLKKSNVARAQINDNAVDMSKGISKLEEVHSWDELFAKYLSKDWKISTTQSFKNDYEFDNPLALISIINTETNEVKYLNANKLDYIYYLADWDPTPNDTKSGISPLEPIDKLKKQSLEMGVYLKDRYKKLGKYPLPKLFEADLRVEDKLMCYGKEHGLGYKLNPQDFINISPKIAYIDIEVYMDEGFEQPNTARKEINAIAYSIGDSTHVDLFVLDKTGKYTAEDLNNSPKIRKMFDNAKKSVIEASETKKGMESVIDRISKYTYDVNLVNTEHELLQCIENKIKEDKPQILTSWNAWFDFNYIINRAKLMKYDDITLSPIGIRGYISSMTGLYEPVGADVLDSLEGYAGTVRGTLKSNKLGYVGLLELGLNKVEYEGELYELYDEDLETFTGYNNFDVVIFKEIDIKRQIMNQKMMYRMVTGCSTRSIDSTIRSSDTVSIEYARRQNLVIRNHTRMLDKTGEYIGAINAARKIGVHYLVADLDQTSQYPSMMRTFNISPNTLVLKIDAPNDVLYKFIHEKKISEKDANMIVNVTVKPLVWFGGKELGIKMQYKLGDILNEVISLGFILTLTGAVFKNHKQEIGFYYTLLTDFKNKRDETKALMKKAHKAGNYILKDNYNNEQLTWKVLQNALYGATGTDSFRFFHIAIAATITTQARNEISVVAYNLDLFIKEWEKRLAS